MRFDDLAGRSVVIWGAGREGRAAYEELSALGIAAVLAVTGDGPVADDLAAVTAVGPAAIKALESAEVVIASPGIPHTSPDFERLRLRQVPVTSLTDLWLSANADRVIAVTGTKGKSTTSSLIQYALAELGISAALVGNGGTPVTVGDRSGAQVAVAEVSSYQAADLSVSPRVAVVTSLYPEHLAWHGGFERYVADKLNLVANRPDAVIVPEDAGDLAELVADRIGPPTRLLSPIDLGLSVTDAGISWSGRGELPADRVPLRGRHNLTNAALAVTAVSVFAGLSRDQERAVLHSVETFPPLKHRLEQVPSADGRMWVDDSLATAPEAVIAALETYSTVRVTLIAGGADRGVPYEKLTSYLAGRVASAPVHVVAVGPAGARLLAGARDALPDARLAPDFATALSWVSADPTESEVVLLSPGAPSFDEFTSYEERSAVFRAVAAGHPPVSTDGAARPE